MQSRRVEAAAQAVASVDAPPADDGAASSSSPVRIGALPVGDPAQSMVTLVEAENAYRLNAAVIRTAADMMDSLLAAVDPRR